MTIGRNYEFVSEDTQLFAFCDMQKIEYYAVVETLAI
jgi:hypothetical protein